MSFLPSLLSPPGSLVAYLPTADPARLSEYLVAFANSDGGTIVLGVSEKGHPTGVYVDEAEQALLAAERLCRPLVQTGWEHAEPVQESAAPDNP